MPRKRAPVPKERPNDLRRAVLDASLALLEDGVGALSMREVARRANVTHGAPYHHFKDRGAILAALAEEGFLALEASMTAEMARWPPGSIERFEGLGRAYVRFALASPAYMRVMFRPELADGALYPSLDDAAGRAMQLLVGCVAECQASGTIAAGDPGPIVLTSWATVHGLACLWIDGPLPRFHASTSPDALADTVAKTLGGLLTSAASLPTPRPRASSRRKEAGRS
jgi:AcrR family transcriptional regulator